MSTDMSKLDRQVRRLLLSTAGRKSLKKFGVDVELAKNEEELKERPIVAVLVPTYRAPDPKMQDSLTSMVRYTREKEIATVYSTPPLGSSVIHWTRNGLVSNHLKSGKPWTHILFIDDDIVVEDDHLEKLLSHKKDIVAGLCTRRNDPPIPNMRAIDPDTGAMTSHVYEWPENELVACDSVGTGLILLSMHTIEQVAQCYMDCLFEQYHYGLTGKRLEEMQTARKSAFHDEKVCYWFDFLPSYKTCIQMGEDMSFCYLAKKFCDIQTYCDTSVQPGHMGPYPYSVRDFLPYRDYCVEQAKRKGTYKALPKMEAELQIVS